MTKDSERNPLEELKIFDPETAETVRAGLEVIETRVASKVLTMLVDETIWGLSREISFGRAIANGFLELIHPDGENRLEKYRDLVRSAGEKGPTIGRILAIYLVPVLRIDDKRLLQRFLETVDIMEQVGTYTLKPPLKSLMTLLDSGRRKSAAVYIDLLNTTFSLPLSYNQSQHFAHVLPGAVLAFSSEKRVWQLEQLKRVMQADFHLTDAFLDGMEKGLHLLSKGALQRFVSLGLEKSSRSLPFGAKFLSLDSRSGFDIFTDLQVAVSILQVKSQLNRYIQARTGLPITVRPMSALPRSCAGDHCKGGGVCSDGRFIYLPDEINVFGQKAENVKLYKCLARFESGHYEFGTFDFDFERMRDRCVTDKCRLPCGAVSVDTAHSDGKSEYISDFERFLQLFPVPALASDLFTIYEHGRIRQLFSRFYPGLVRTYLPMLRKEALRQLGDGRDISPLLLLYAEIALGIPVAEQDGIDAGIKDWVQSVCMLYEEKMSHPDFTAEACGELVVRTYREVEELLKHQKNNQHKGDKYTSLRIPFDRRLRPDLYDAAYLPFENMAQKIKEKLSDNGIRIYKSVIKKYLAAQQDFLRPEDLREIPRASEKHSGIDRRDYREIAAALCDLNRADLTGISDTSGQGIDIGRYPVFWYPEWDCRLGDYLNDHARVIDKSISGHDSDFYHCTLQRYRALVQRIRYSFELLKPEGLKLYRRWIEGDEFDYRALLDFVLDKKANRTPSERLYIKRLKEERDVAVLLLVDLSRSTSNTAAGSTAAVIDVEKEAIVLFSEALEIVGDVYAIAGFSGTGRLGVDYFHIKDFSEQMNDIVRRRITAVTPQRNTRMGAAIRHAAFQFSSVLSKVRLLIILGDGFPNDLDYKRDYAIADTRKAISELRSQNIHVHAITININLTEESELDDLYGDIHHNVITEIAELPDKLWRIYGALTH